MGTFTTIISFDRPFSADEWASFNTKNEEMVSSGKATSEPELTTYNGVQAFTRKYVNQAAAEEWLSFIKTFDPPPVIAVVEVN